MTPDPPSPRTGRTPGLVIAVVLAINLVVPAAYYLTPGDGYDERFAWRMFSTRRAETCAVRVIEHRGPAAGPTHAARLDLSRVVHAGWQSALERRRPPVVDAFLAWRCDLGGGGVDRVVLQTRCGTAGGEALEPASQTRRCRPEAP